MALDRSGAMAGHGFYAAHSVPQGSAGSFGLPLLERAVAAVPLPTENAPLVVADLGAAGGKNELGPLDDAIGRLRRERGVDAPIVVVHTDIATNDFTALFQTVEGDAATYLRWPETYAFAAGRSFYERIFPPASVTIGWSAIAVHWLSRVPKAIDGHVYCAFARSDVREALMAQSAADWHAFLVDRAAELVPGGQLVVVGGAATDDYASGAEGLMNALNAALEDAVARGSLTANEYAAMTIPTWNRTEADFIAPFTPELPLQLEEHALHVLADPFIAEYERSHDAGAFADAISAFLRGFTEPSLFGSLERPAEERTLIADAVYADVRRRAADDPHAVATAWRVVTLRMSRR